jgi:hypothetical protein
MGYDFIAVSHVDACDHLPNNARPYAECMYRTDDDTYYECSGNTGANATYYKATNRSHTMAWSINLHAASELAEALVNQGIDIRNLFSQASHSSATLRPLLQQIHTLNNQQLDNALVNRISGLIPLLECVCDGDNGILLNV